MLNCTAHGSYHSILESRGGMVTEEVPGLRLERIFAEHDIERCDFLKCDCEGAEYQIFSTLPDSLLSRIDKVAMEWHGGDDREERIAQANQLIDRLLASGFRIESFTEHVELLAARSSPGELLNLEHVHYASAEPRPSPLADVDQPP